LVRCRGTRLFRARRVSSTGPRRRRDSRRRWGAARRTDALRLDAAPMLRPPSSKDDQLLGLDGVHEHHRDIARTDSRHHSMPLINSLPPPGRIGCAISAGVADGGSAGLHLAGHRSSVAVLRSGQPPRAGIRSRSTLASGAGSAGGWGSPRARRSRVRPRRRRLVRTRS
jgi:hypothetical protein